jgi:hypothetical protein
MTLDERLRAVAEAEARCAAQTERARTSWQTVKSNAKQLATPWRIVAAGAVLGFLAGRKSKPGDNGIGSKFLAAATQAVVTAFGAGISAEAGTDIEHAVQAGMAAGAREAKADVQADAASGFGGDAPTEP